MDWWIGRRHYWFHHSLDVNIWCPLLDDVRVCVHVDEHWCLFVFVIDLEHVYWHWYCNVHVVVVVVVVFWLVNAHNPSPRNGWHDWKPLPSDHDGEEVDDDDSDSADSTMNLNCLYEYVTHGCGENIHCWCHHSYLDLDGFEDVAVADPF